VFLDGGVAAKHWDEEADDGAGQEDHGPGPKQLRLQLAHVIFDVPIEAHVHGDRDDGKCWQLQKNFKNEIRAKLFGTIFIWLIKFEY